MKFKLRFTPAIAIAGVSAVAALMAPSAALAQPPVPNGRGGSRFTQDPRVETRMYHFDDTNVDLPYSLYVSTKVTKGQKAPLVVSLHGLGATQTIMMTKAAVD